jgi:hypothetical protein
MIEQEHALGCLSREPIGDAAKRWSRKSLGAELEHEPEEDGVQPVGP